MDALKDGCIPSRLPRSLSNRDATREVAVPSRKKSREREWEKLPWYAVVAALKWTEKNPQDSWEQITQGCCPCGRANHTPRCQRELRRAVERLKHEREIERALASLRESKPGRPADYPTHVLVAILKEQQHNPALTYAELVEKYCPCKLDFPTRTAHTRACREAMRRALRRFKERMRKLRLDLDFLLEEQPRPLRQP